MTASSTASTELSIDTIVRRGMQLAGMMDPGQGSADPAWTAKAAMARDFLEQHLESLQGIGLFQRAVDFYDITMVDGTSSYTMPAATLDVFGVAMHNLSGESDQFQVEIVDRDRYFRITDKTLESDRPTLYFPQRSQSIVVYVWPVPNQAGTLRVQREKALATATSGSATMDFERHWTEHFVWNLAHDLSVASGISPERCAYIRGIADSTFKAASSKSAQQNASSHLQLAHSTGWER